jgi:hypothetical protein
MDSNSTEIDVFIGFPLSPTLSPLVPRGERGFTLMPSDGVLASTTKEAW